MHEEKLDDFLKNYNENTIIYQRKMSVFDKIFGSKKEEIVKLFSQENINIKTVLDDLKKREIVSAETNYKTFYAWLQKSKKLYEKNTENSSEMSGIIQQKNNENVDSNYVKNATQNDNILPEVNDEKRELFNKYFYGFNMDLQPDKVTNITPINEELEWRKANEIFNSDPYLDNHKIGVILVATIIATNENDWTETWMEVLMKENETLEEYYARLQLYVDSNDYRIAKSIFDATSAFERFAHNTKAENIRAVRMTR
jgi:hypothetical protein